MLDSIRNTSKHSAVYALGNIAAKIIGIILIPIYTDPQFLSQVDFGALAILEASAQVLTGVFAMAMTSSLQRWYWDENYASDQKSIYFSTLALLVVINLPLFSLMATQATWFSSIIFDTEAFRYLIRLTLLTAGIRIINNQMQLVLRLRSKSVYYTTLQVSKLAITLVLTIWFVVGKGKGLEGIWEAAVIGEMAVFLFILPFTLRNVELRIHLKVLKEMMTYGYPLMLSTASILVLTVTDRYMLKFLSGLEATAVYAIGLRLANTLNMVISTSLHSALAPLRMKMINREDNHRFYSKVLTYSSYAFVLGFLALSLFSLELLKVFTSDPNYWAANSIIPILSMAFLLMLMRQSTNIGLIIKKKTRIIAVLMFSTTVINLALNYILIPVMDIYGAALATLLSQLILFIAICSASQKAYKIPYEWRKIGVMIFLLILFVGAGLLMGSLPVVLRLFLKMMLFISFPFVLGLFGFYEDAEKKAIGKIVRLWKDPRNLGKNIKRLLSPGKDDPPAPA